MAQGTQTKTWGFLQSSDMCPLAPRFMRNCGLPGQQLQRPKPGGSWLVWASTLKCRIVPHRSSRGAGPCSLTLGINVPFPKGLRPGLLPHFPPEVLYSSFSGLNQKVLLSSAVSWCLAPKSSFHRKFCSLGSPASLWAPYSVFSGQHTSSSRYCILLPASSCGAQNHHSTSLQGYLRARRTCRIPRPGSHAVAEHTDCPSHPSPLSRLLS